MTRSGPKPGRLSFWPVGKLQQLVRHPTDDREGVFLQTREAVLFSEVHTIVPSYRPKDRRSNGLLYALAPDYCRRSTIIVRKPGFEISRTEYSGLRRSLTLGTRLPRDL